MTEQVKPEQRFDWLRLVWVVLFCGWLFGVPELLLQSAISVPIMGVATPEEQTRRDSLLTWAAIIAVVLPLVGVVLAGIFRRKTAAIIFGVMLLLVGSGLGYQALYRARHQPNPPNDHSVCQEHSGSDNVCPGN